MNDTTNGSNSSTEIDEETQNELKPVIPPSQVQFWTFMIFQIPSLACSVFLLYHLLINRHLRQALHNHVIIIFLFLTFCIEIFDNPLYIDAYRLGGYHNSFTMTIPICLMWWLLDYGFYGAITVFLAWASIERHILVFHHHQLLRTKRQRFFVHYFPLILLSIYLIVFYLIAIYFPPCKNTFDFKSLGCGFSPCYEDHDLLNTWDYLGNGIVCSFIETLSSSALIIRIILLKRRVTQQLNWRKNRKMTFQLLSISCLSLAIVLPQSLILVIQQIGGPNYSEFGVEADPYFFYLYNYIVFLLPFICLGHYPELWKKLRLFKRKPRAVGCVISQLAENRQVIIIKPRPSE